MLGDIRIRLDLRIGDRRYPAAIRPGNGQAGIVSSCLQGAVVLAAIDRQLQSIQIEEPVSLESKLFSFLLDDIINQRLAIIAIPTECRIATRHQIVQPALRITSVIGPCGSFGGDQVDLGQPDHLQVVPVS